MNSVEQGPSQMLQVLYLVVKAVDVLTTFVIHSKLNVCAEFLKFHAFLITVWKTLFLLFSPFPVCASSIIPE